MAFDNGDDNGDDDIIIFGKVYSLTKDKSNGDDYKKNNNHDKINDMIIRIRKVMIRIIYY